MVPKQVHLRSLSPPFDDSAARPSKPDQVLAYPLVWPTQAFLSSPRPGKLQVQQGKTSSFDSARVSAASRGPVQVSTG